MAYPTLSTSTKRLLAPRPAPPLTACPPLSPAPPFLMQALSGPTAAPRRRIRFLATRRTFSHADVSFRIQSPPL
jgi:hypothetical protein